MTTVQNSGWPTEDYPASWLEYDWNKGTWEADLSIYGRCGIRGFGSWVITYMVPAFHLYGY